MKLDFDNISKEKRKKTTELHLVNKHITSLPENTGDFVNLEILNLSRNNLTSLPDNLFKLTKLYELDISRNRLTYLPTKIGNFLNLNLLDISYNKISCIPSGVMKIPRLSYFYLDHNPLKSLSNIRWDTLEEMDIKIDLLTIEGGKMYYTKNWNKLYKYYRKSTIDLVNQYVYDQNSLTQPEKKRLIHEAGKKEINFLRKKLSIEDPIVKNITNHDIPESERKVLEYFREPKFKKEKGHIVELDLKNKKLTTLPESIGNLKSLKQLILSGCQLTSLPESIGNLKSLKYLTIINNRLAYLPESIGNCTSLKFLDLSINYLTFLPDSIINLSLRSLKIVRNKITFLPEDFKKNSKVVLVVSGTPLRSLSNIPRKTYCHLHFTGEHLTKKGKKLYIEKNYEELAQYYNKSCKILAKKYLSNPKSLTKDEKERLIYEIGKSEENFLESQLPLDDPLLKKIMEKNSLKLANGSKIYL